MDQENPTLWIHGRLAKAMASLDPQARKLLTLFLEGLSLPEIAAEMEDNEDAISRAILDLVWETRENLAA